MRRRIKAEVAVPDVPGFGYRSFFIRREKGGRPSTPRIFDSGERPYRPIARHPRLLDNGLVRLEVNADGAINLTDLDTGERFERMLELVDNGCRGDVWVHHAPNHDRIITSSGAPTQVAVVCNSGLRATVSISTTMRLPISLTADREARSSNDIATDIQTEITLHRGSKRVDICTSFENKARDHFLRVRIPTAIATDSCWCDAPFDVIERRFTLSGHDGLCGPELVRQSFGSFVDVSDGRTRGLALFARTNKEFGLETEDGAATLVLSLLRATNGSYPMDLFVMVDTDDQFAQCLGRQRFEYALYPHAGRWRDADLPRHCAEYLHPCIAVQSSKGRNPGTLPLASGSFLQLERGALLLSCVKKSEDRASWIVRLFNPCDEEVQDKLMLFRRPSHVEEVRLDESHLRTLELDAEGAVPLVVAPHKIITLALSFDGAMGEVTE